MRSISPILEDFGEERGIKNSARVGIYRAYQKRNGQLYSKCIGHTRYICEENEKARLFRTNGRNPDVKKGDIAVLRDNKRSSFSIMGQASFGNDPRYGGRLEYGYLLNMSSKGLAQYFLTALGYWQYNKEPIGVWSSEEENIQPQWHNFDIMVGYGIGFNICGKFEIMPYALGGISVPMITGKNDAKYYLQVEGPTWVSYGNHWPFMGISGYFGAKMNINICYPLQLSFGADYNLTSFLTPERSDFQKEHGLNLASSYHTNNRLNLYVGLRLRF